jgi:subtilase family serine protease
VHSSSLFKRWLRGSKARRIASRDLGRKRKPLLEELERRLAPAGASPTYIHIIPADGVPAQTPTPQGEGYTPNQVRDAYGINEIESFYGQTADGTGQTIAIVDVYNDPDALKELDGFDKAVYATSGSSTTLYQEYGPASSFFSVYNQNGINITANIASSGVGNVPPVDPVGQGPGVDDWEGEEALDIEWAHSIAPGAKIDLVEASNNLQGLYTAEQAAAALPGVSVVSNSWGGGESGSELSTDIDFTTPSGHQGVTFLASAGDDGWPGGYPAYSPNVVAVGGTALTLNANNTIESEVAWSTGFGPGSGAGEPDNGTGGGTSLYEPEPSYQEGVQSTGFRTMPDVSFVASPYTGVAIYDSYNYGTTDPWTSIGGTSLSCPCWAGLIAIVNQGRTENGSPTLNSATDPQQTLDLLYSLPTSDFHDITVGSNYSQTTGQGFAAGPGYDEVSGIGTPIANLLVPDLVGPLVAFTSTPNIDIANASSISVAGTGDNGDTVTVAITDSGKNTTSTATATVSGGTWAVSGINASLLLDGTVTYSVTETSGRTGFPTTRTQAETKDTVVPKVSFTSTPNITVANLSDIVVTGTGDDGDTVSVTIADGTHTTTAATATVSGGIWSVSGINPTALSDGPVTYSVTETDAVGNTTTITQAENKSTESPNLAMINASVVDMSGNALDPVDAGEAIYIQADFTAQELASNVSYIIAYTVNGLTLDSGTIKFGDGLATLTDGTNIGGPFIAAAGPNQVSVTIDPNDTVKETTFNDNTFAFNFNAVLTAGGSSSYLVQQIRAAYGINSIPNFGSATADGTGQTIAIVDAGNDPTILSDLDGFDEAMSFTANPTPTLYQQYGPASSILTVYNQAGTNITANIANSGSGGVPTMDPSGAWEAEETLDVEWAHAIAPGAKIDLIEVNDNASLDANLLAGDSIAAGLSGVSVVSNSWDQSEASGETADDSSIFVTPSGHTGVTFLAGSYANGTNADYPATSPNAVSVGGTQLTLNGDAYGSETGWSFATPTTLNYASGSETQVGSWTFQAGGFNGYSTAAGGSSSSASWTTTIPSSYAASGTEVSATWTASPGNATNATYTIYDGAQASGVVLGTVVVNQTQSPIGTVDGNSQFQELGIFYPTSGTITVVLNASSANGTVVADTIGIAPGLASGGGASQVEPEPSYQLLYQSDGFRTSPDVSFDASETSGVACYQNGQITYDNFGSGLSTACWAGLIAIANQGLVASGGTTLNSAANPTQTVQALYSLPAGDFHDITTGYDGNSATAGYNEVTGRGTPIANLLIPDLINFAQLSLSQSSVAVQSTVLYGSTTTVTLTAKEATGKAETSGGLSVLFGLGAGSSSGTFGSVTDNGNGTYTAAFTGTAVGTPLTISATIDGYAVTSGLPTITVTLATLTITPGAGQSDPYGSLLAVAGTTYTPSGFVNGDNASLLSGELGTTTTARSTVGRFTLGTLSAGPNYTLQLAANSPSFTATAIVLTVTDNQMKVYGAAMPLLTASYAGFVNGDTGAVLSGLPSLSTSAKASSNAGAYTITVKQGTLSDPNYLFNIVNGTFTITQATLHVTAVNKTKVYGAALPALAVTYTGFVNGNTSSIIKGTPSLSATATSQSPVGTYSIGVGQGTLSAQQNYVFNFVGAALSVTPATLTVTAASKTMVYGSSVPGLTVSYAGFVNGDSAASLTAQPTVATNATASSPAGKYSLVVSGASDSNYNIHYVNGTLTISQAKLTVTALNQIKFVGAALPVLTFMPSGFVNGDTAADLSGAPSLSTTAKATSPVGTYAITAKQGTLSDPNYTFVFVPGTLTVIPVSAAILQPASAPAAVTAADLYFETLAESNSSQSDYALVGEKGPSGG